MPASTTRPGTEMILGEIASTLALSKSELARMFGISRQALSDWADRGIPAKRLPKVASVAATCDLLRHYLRPERIPGIARLPAEGYGGRTMLEMIEQDRHEELRERVRRSFDWDAA